jgi:hypothetical protein
MTIRPITPQDVLADGAEGHRFEGTYVRKGSIAAFITNVKLLETLDPVSSDYQEVADQIRSLKPSLDAVGLFDVVEVRNPAVRLLLDG